MLTTAAPTLFATSANEVEEILSGELPVGGGEP